VTRFMMISSDGHVAARMPEYRPYLEREFLPDFNEFLVVYEREGVSTTDLAALERRLDPDALQEWNLDVVQTGRLDATGDPERRLIELDREGIAAEVLFHEFQTPFLLSNPGRAAMLGLAPPTPVQHAAGLRAFNRWVLDFASVAPDRWRPMLALTFDDFDAAMDDVRWAAEAGFTGVSLPTVPEGERVYQDRYDPMFALLQETGLVVNVHAAVANAIPAFTHTRNAASGAALVAQEMMSFGPSLLSQLIWGGVMERFPDLRFVFTELHSDWTVGALARMDHSWTNGDLCRDVRDVVKRPPSEYWARQCFLGSSLFSRAEIEARAAIGVDKLMVGVDFPHHEGCWKHGTSRYLQATFGSAGVAEHEARQMLGATAAEVFRFDVDKLTSIAERIGPESAEILIAPRVEPLFRGDLRRPFAFV
jgi:predicted TIM-barrel fold metal-dependent hydrolase